MNENTIKYSSAGNLVCLTMDKLYNITSFNIDESLLSKEQKDLLEEMIASSVNEAINKVKELNKKNDDDDMSEKNNRQYSNPFNNINLSDMNQMFSDISKMTSVEYKDGKINIALDSITPDMISKMNDMMNNLNKNDDDNKKE